MNYRTITAILLLTGCDRIVDRRIEALCPIDPDEGVTIPLTIDFNVAEEISGECPNFRLYFFEGDPFPLGCSTRRYAQPGVEYHTDQCGADFDLFCNTEEFTGAITGDLSITSRAGPVGTAIALTSGGCEAVYEVDAWPYIPITVEGR